LARYAPTVIVRYVAFARLFLRYLERQHVRLDEVEPAHVEKYLACELVGIVDVTDEWPPL
jgi:hypothetical protein